MEQSKRKEQIADAAIGLIAKLGYAQASVGRIADAAGVSKGVFTYHFASKDELMEHIVRGVHEKAARFMRRIGTESTPGRMLGAYIETNCAFIAAHREEIAALSDIVTSARTPEG
ncbi:MAG TPA: TetR/AcrR family transcriptional regulator, partial [Paenibacillus sp.]|nr:TetR/AcrR family transcriptional regulator [Paenibacillus sp.]